MITERLRLRMRGVYSTALFVTVLAGLHTGNDAVNASILQLLVRKSSSVILINILLL
jgi:hypothetical protein